jgi:hypothetical protein
MSPKKQARIEIEMVGETITKIRILPDGRMAAKDAALYLGVEPQTLAEWRWRGDRGPDWVKIQGRIWYFRKALDAHIAKGRQRRPVAALIAAPE